MGNKKRKSLFIVAGSPASGKTTLLHNAHRDGIDLFGEKNRKSFHSCIDLMIQRAEADGFGPNYLRITQLSSVITKRYDYSWDDFVLHLDLFAFYARQIHYPNDAPTSVDEKLFHPETDPSRAAQVGAFFDTYFGEFDRVIINTIHCDFNTNLVRFVRRRDHTFPRLINRPYFLHFKRRYLHKRKKTAHEMHNNMYRSWYNDLKKLAPTAQFRTDQVNGEYEIQELEIDRSKLGLVSDPVRGS